MGVLAIHEFAMNAQVSNSTPASTNVVPLYDVVREKLLTKISAKDVRLKDIEAMTAERNNRLSSLRALAEELREKLASALATSDNEMRMRKEFETDLNLLGTKISELEATEQSQRVRNETLVQRNRQLQAQLRQVEAELNQHNSRIEELGSKLAAIETMPTLSRTPKQLKEDEEARNVFDLGPDQYVICEHFCSHNDINGRLFVTPEYLCFVASKEPARPIKFNYRDISNVEKIQKRALGVEIKKAIKVSLNDNTDCTFAAFPHRGTAFRDILRQGNFHGLPWAQDPESRRASVIVGEDTEQALAE
eukprot:c14325_g1_i1.p1 GENE.c14325_g1_i1~~c14325_g1_i1.p1  ORF type:complete len:306 (+),score=65.52 c14325_g1_i1:2-919(+)